MKSTSLWLGLVLLFIVLYFVIRDEDWKAVCIWAALGILGTGYLLRVYLKE